MLIEAVILAVIQGLTEYLPISSSAHLVVIPYLLGFSSPLTTGSENELKNVFDVALHLGTTFAVIIYFWQDIWKLSKTFFEYVALEMSHQTNQAKPEQPYLILYLLAGSIPAGLCGFFFEKSLEHYLKENILVICIALYVVSLLMLYAENFYNNRFDKKHLGDISLKDSIFIGLAQCFALIPGISRSGITIVTGLFLNYKREEAARFSFLLSTPIIIGASAYKLLKLPSNFPPEIIVPFISGVVLSFIVGILTIKVLLSYLRRYELSVFAYYRIGLATLLLLYFTLVNDKIF